MSMKGVFPRSSPSQPAPVSGRSTSASAKEEPPLAPVLSSRPSSDHDKIPADDQRKIDFLADKPGHMTYGRRLALWSKDRYAWYNPQLAESDRETPEDGAAPVAVAEKPSLEKAWAFFEHVTLERFVVRQADDKDRSSSVQLHAEEDTTRLGALEKASKEIISKGFHRGDRALSVAEPGENELPTKLYPVLTTPLSQLGDFGLGYGLYFSTLRAYAFLCLLAGILNIPNLIYFASEEYSGGQPGVSTLLKGSAICTDQTWVPCPTCDPSQFASVGSYTTVRDVYDFGGAVADELNGDWLNITDHVIFNDNGFQVSESRLRNDHGIVIHHEEARIEVEGLYNITYDEDSINCEANGPNQCYLWVGNATGDTSLGQTRINFALKNNCDGATLQQGFINYATLIFMAIGALTIRFRQNRLEVAFDEDEQTAQDYSIAVLNPPGDAYEPDEWKAFFEEAFECKVTVCTVHMDNDIIVQNLVERRELQRKLELKIPVGSSVSTELKQELETKPDGGFMARFKGKKQGPVQDLVERIKGVSDKIRDELKASKGHPTSKVFVTFETETAQRSVLSALTVGTRASDRNDTNCHSNSSYLFRGKHVLAVVEPEEPSTIRWQDLNATRSKVYTRLALTSFATCIAILLAYAAIMGLYTFKQMYLASLVTTIFTIGFPMFARLLLNKEVHHSETSSQKWLFIKVAIFNVLITTVLLSLVTPFDATLDNKEGGENGLIASVHALFFSQLLLTPALQLADIGGNIQRHLLAPRAKTQTEMNLCMKGSPVELAERYANLIKYLFLMLWYCSIYPLALFMGSLALLIVYFADRFSLMRTWARAPQLGTEIADFARNYFTPVAFVFMAVISAYTWSGFPFDNLCEDDGNELPPYFYGDWGLRMRAIEYKVYGYTIYTSGRDRTANFTVAEGDQAYKFCEQDLRFTAGPSFPALPRFQASGFEWMTEEQETLVNVYGWTSVFVLGVVVSLILFRFIKSVLLRLYQSTYSPKGKDMQVPFSTVDAIDSYIPQVHSDLFPHPLLLCDIKDIDPKLFNWTDPDQPHSAYDITKDIDDIVGDSGLSTLHVFSKVKHWPPSNKDEMQDEASVTSFLPGETVDV